MISTFSRFALRLVLLGTAMACRADVAVLWWLIEGGESVDWYGTQTTVDGFSDMKGPLSARVAVLDSSGATIDHLNFWQLDADNVPYPADGVGVDSWGVPPINAFADLGNYGSAEYSFAVELGNWDYDQGGWVKTYVVSETRSYDSLASNISTWKSGDLGPDYTTEWRPVNFHVPEPSGGLLLLIGGGLLALRRRRRV